MFTVLYTFQVPKHPWSLPRLMQQNMEVLSLFCQAIHGMNPPFSFTIISCMRIVRTSASTTTTPWSLKVVPPSLPRSSGLRLTKFNLWLYSSHRNHNQHRHATLLTSIPIYWADLTPSVSLQCFCYCFDFSAEERISTPHLRHPVCQMWFVLGWASFSDSTCSFVHALCDLEYCISLKYFKSILSSNDFLDWYLVVGWIQFLWFNCDHVDVISLT